MQSFGTDTASQSFFHSFSALSSADDTLFEVGPEIRGLGVSSR